MREINQFPPGSLGEHVPCYGKCGQLLSLSGARVCAILICSTCRKDPKKLVIARHENGRHMRAHTIHERQTNPWYPFPDFHTAWSAT